MDPSSSTFAKPQVIPYVEETLDHCTLFDCKWVPSSARFVVMGTTDKSHGFLRVYSMASASSIKLLADTQRPDPIKCGTFGASSLEDRHLTTGDFEGHLATWDLENIAQGPIFSVKGHKEIINAVDAVGGLGVGRGAPEIATASRDGCVKIWDPRLKDRPVACMQPKGDIAKPRDCWTVAFGHAHSDSDRMVAAGYDNGDIKMFDLRTMGVHWETQVPNGVCSVAFDRRDIDMNKLLATCLEGRMHMWDLRTMHPKDGFAGLAHRVQKGHASNSATLWAGKFLPQNREIFATLGGSGGIGLYKYAYPDKRSKKLEDGNVMGVAGKIEKLQEASVGDQPISGFDWSPDKTGLAVCTSFDQKVRLVIVTKLNTV